MTTTTRGREVLVASVPENHVYVRHLTAGPDDGVRRLADPIPEGADRSDQQTWWPPVMLDPAWVADAEFDVFHVQFGFDACDPERLREVVGTLRRRGKPLVYTVHDLRNPHHEERGLHDAQLDVLVPAADALVTLTAGAAREIGRRWGREAHVVPHPHVVDLPIMQRFAEHPVRTPGTLRVGLHVKSLRASMDPGPLLDTLVAFAASRPDTVVQVNGHREVLEPGGPRYAADLAERLASAARAGLIDLRVHEFDGDDESFFTYLASLDVSVLPYRFGTHSGWLEACRDVGTTVVASSCGYYADQAPVLSYTHDEHRFDPDSLRDALEAAAAQPGLGRVSVAERREQREAVAAFHRDLYAGLLAAGD